MKTKNRVKFIAVNCCRLIVSLAFIFSGFVKAVDPLGTQYKIVDYLIALNIEGYVPDWLTLSVSVLLSALEFCLGVFLLLAMHRRFCAKLATWFMGVMLLVTLWLVVANPIQDCGCFGDAVKLSNTQTFVKNLILMAATLVVCRWPYVMPRFVSIGNQWIAINYTIVYILATSVVSLYFLPSFDFRPYHVGANIREGMQIPEGAPQPQFETTFLMEKDGVRKTFSLENYPDTTWTLIDSETKQISEGYVPPIHDFFIEDKCTGDDLTEDILADKGYTFLLVAPHLETASESNFGDIDYIYEYAQEHHYAFYCLTASDMPAVERWKDLTGAEYPFCTTDEITLKTIIRSNPGLLLIKDGTVLRKWSHNDLPQAEQLTEPLEKSELGQMDTTTTGARLLKVFLWFALPLILLGLTDRLWAWTGWIRRNKESYKINQLLNKKKS